MGLFSPSNGRLAHPWLRLAWLGLALAPACGLSGWLAAGQLPEHWVPRNVLAFWVGGTALFLFAWLFLSRGALHLAMWAGVAAAGGMAWHGNVAEPVARLLERALNMRTDPLFSLSEPRMRQILLGYLVVIGTLWLVQALGYVHGTLVGRRLPVRFDGWLGMRVKSRPGNDQWVALVVYPHGLVYERLNGLAFTEADQKIRVRSTPLPKREIQPSSDAPTSCPAGKWITIPAADGGDFALVYSRIDAPLMWHDDPSDRPLRSVLSPSFDGFWLSDTDLSATQDLVEQVPIEGETIRLPAPLKAPSTLGILEVILTLASGPSEAILRVERLRLSGATLEPVGPNILAETLRVELGTAAAVRLVIVVEPPEGSASSAAAIESRIGTLLESLGESILPPLVGVEIRFARSQGTAGERVLLVKAGETSDLWLVASRPEGPELAAASPAIAFVKACHAWLRQPEAPLPEAIGLDARTGALIGRSVEFRGHSLQEFAGVFLLVEPDGTTRYVPAYGSPGRIVLKAASRIFGPRLI